MGVNLNLELRGARVTFELCKINGLVKFRNKFFIKD